MKLVAHDEPPRHALFHPLERLLAVLAAAACLFITVAIWRSVSANQPMWPLPGFYFAEVSLAALVVAWAFLTERAWGAMAAWAAAGLYLSFAIMGAFSVGIFYVPITIMFILLAVLATVRQELPFLNNMSVFLVTAMLQAAVMFLVIRLMYPGS